MSLSAFGDRAAPPQPDAVAATLGPAHPLWESLRTGLAAACDDYSEVWGYTAKSTGWGLRAKDGDRVVVYLTPREGEFLASLAMGEKAVVAARAAGLPDRVLAVVDGARRYAEGRAVRLTVSTEADVDAVLRLASAKLHPGRP
jgi:hypothetical protein